MQVAKDAMKIALRVLTALGDKQEPDDADISELRCLAPEKANGPVDELACEVILHSVRRRAEVRSRLSS
jgi:hypothetical protein